MPFVADVCCRIRVPSFISLRAAMTVPPTICRNGTINSSRHPLTNGAPGSRLIPIILVVIQCSHRDGSIDTLGELMPLHVIWQHVLQYRAILLGLAGLVVLAVIVWQGVTQQGAPDPTEQNLSPTAVVLDSGILVFREGLEAILVLAAITASLVRTTGSYARPIAAGA